MLTIKSEPYKDRDIFENLKAGDLFRADVGATDEIWIIFIKTDTVRCDNGNNNAVSCDNGSNNGIRYALRLDNGVLYSFLPTKQVKPIRDAQLIIK